MKYILIVSLVLVVISAAGLLAATIVGWLHQPIEEWIDTKCSECGFAFKKRAHWPSVCGTCSIGAFK